IASISCSLTSQFGRLRWVGNALCAKRKRIERNRWFLLRKRTFRWLSKPYRVPAGAGGHGTSPVSPRPAARHTPPPCRAAGTNENPCAARLGSDGSDLAGGDAEPTPPAGLHLRGQIEADHPMD